MFDSPFQPTVELEEWIDARIDEVLQEFSETIAKVTAQLGVQDKEIARLRAEIISMRPKPIARRGVDIDTAQVELR